MHSAISSHYIRKALWVFLPFPGGLFEDVTKGVDTSLSTAWGAPAASSQPSGQQLQRQEPGYSERTGRCSFEFTCSHLFSRRRVNFKSLKHQGCEESHSSRLRDKYRIFISVSHREEHSDTCCVSTTWRERELAETQPSCVEAARGFAGGIES